MPANSLPMVVGLIFASFAIISTFLLMRRGKLTFHIRLGILGLAVLIGFLFLAPMFPLQIQQAVLGNAQQPIPVWGLLTILSIILLSAFMFGRTFCGYGCPIGTLQELTYRIPFPKYDLHNTRAAHLVRSLVLGIIIILGVVFSFSVLGTLGIMDFFSLDVASIGTAVFATVVVVSIFYYRPFCRLACPFGVFQAIASRTPHYAIRRTKACVRCKKCETVCPTDQAKIGSNKAECYLCLRCLDACPKDALVYNKEEKVR